MNIHSYIAYDDSSDHLNIHDLYARIGDYLMKYQIDLDESIGLMMLRGEVPNIFLKQAGFDEFVKELINQLEREKNEILEKYNPQLSQSELKNNLKNITENYFEENNPDLKKDLSQILDLDSYYKYRWQKNTENKHKQQYVPPIINKIGDILSNMELLESAEKNFRFTGKQKLDYSEIIPVIKRVFEIEKLILALKESLQNGDFSALNPDQLRKILGEERYMEFLELQQKIIETIKKMLEEKGFVYQNDPDEDYQLSAKGIDYLSSRSLSEIYSHLQNDSSGLPVENISPDGNQVTSKSRIYEFGDNFYNIDWNSSITDAFIKNNRRFKLSDISVYESRGNAKNSIVILLDMSGSMYRYGRFYYAKKMILALDRLMKLEHPSDRIEIIGFGSLAKRYSVNDIVMLQPHPVVFTDPFIRLKLDLSLDEETKKSWPLYFTNLQAGLSLSRKLLGTKESKNRQIILITDGVPTAHISHNKLNLNYPPVKQDFQEALKEAVLCREDDIIINTFLLSGEWWENFFNNSEGNSFATDFVKATGGRFFQTDPNELGVIVLYDFITGRKKEIRMNNSKETSQ